MTKSHLKQLGIRQNSRAELVSFRVDVSDVSDSATGTGGLDEGSNYATILKTATGKYTLTWNRKPRRTPVVVGYAVIGEGFIEIDASNPTTTDCDITINDDAGTDIDADFHITFLMFYAETER